MRRTVHFEIVQSVVWYGVSESEGALWWDYWSQIQSCFDKWSKLAISDVWDDLTYRRLQSRETSTNLVAFKSILGGPQAHCYIA